jgi:hypothetical protein
VLADVNKSIEALLKAELPADMASQVSISFATPDESFPPNGLSLPAINLFLFQIHENAELRSMEPILERQTDGSMTRVPPSVRVDCHYLVTAVAEKQSGPEQDEHRILGAVLKVLLRHRILPGAVLQGALAGATPPVRALAARKDATGIEIWQALKGKPRASLHYTLTVPLDVSVPESVAAPVTALSVGGV